MPAAEELKFKIGLSGTYWDKKPQYEILLDKNVKHTGTISTEPGITEYIEFTASVEGDADHYLQIRLTGKEDQDTIVSADGIIEKDMLLNIVEVEIDDIELEFLKWSHSVYTPDVPQEGFPSNMHVNLGLNGTYEIKFSSPFYIWILSEM
jgi:hypothetical protein